MQVISVQSVCGGTGVSLTAAELALKARSEGQRVLAVDLCQNRQLRRDLSIAGFHQIEDSRQLFRPLCEARWGRSPFPRAALMCFPFSRPSYLSVTDEGRLTLNHEPLIERGPVALQCLEASVRDLSVGFDVMVIDVSTKDRTTMRMVAEVSDEVHVMLRTVPDFATAGHWYAFIGVADPAALRCEVFTHEDRNRTPAELDQMGRSSALLDFYQAAERGDKPGGDDRQAERAGA
ncbi:cellulose synthase operon protein YhjQ/BcsQ [Novosphingobium aerophilum]|uniref:Uncharacterized protein n=1 Tax=Novosphingobium aerophilum TaxID=2839843 RepID=A0A7X1F4Y4_9SPHN|nr:cellulose synthase operon protein YhjQ/BcsQ [Novosphingobium aerophilum]MBC2650491.1 hypothetical protein [Novosphingobium aerophilum]